MHSISALEVKPNFVGDNRRMDAFNSFNPCTFRALLYGIQVWELQHCYRDQSSLDFDLASFAANIALLYLNTTQHFKSAVSGMRVCGNEWAKHCQRIFGHHFDTQDENIVLECHLFFIQLRVVISCEKDNIWNILLEKCVQTKIIDNLKILFQLSTAFQMKQKIQGIFYKRLFIKIYLDLFCLQHTKKDLRWSWMPWDKNRARK